MTTSTMATLLGWFLHSSVKGAVLVVLVGALLIVIGPRLGARWRHVLWLVVLLRLALPVAPQSSWSIFNLIPQATPQLRQRTGVTPVIALTRSRTVDAAPMVRAAHLPRTIAWAKWGFALWAIGAFLLMLRAAIASFLLQRAVSRELRRGNERPDLLPVVDEARRRLGIGRQVRVVECSAVSTPALHGLIHPTVLLPAGMADSFTRDELRHVVVHELWHLRRLDVALNWILSIAQALHWFNPFVWYATSRIREERELACDELALSCLEQEERAGYGRTILKLLETFRSAAPMPALVGIVDSKQKVKRRLMMIASYGGRTRFSLLFVAAVALVSVLGLTDASGGERRMMNKILDPAAAATAEKLHQRLSFELANVSFGELLSAVGAKAGVPITQSPDLATSNVQQARFTIKAENVPVHAVLHEALAQFGAAPIPTADGVSVEKAEGHVRMRVMHGEGGGHGQHPMMRHRVSEEATGEAGEKTIERKIVITTGSPAGEPAMRDPVREAPPGSVNEEVVVRRKAGPAMEAVGTDGKTRKELNLKFNHDGVTTEGKLTIEIEVPPTK